MLLLKREDAPLYLCIIIIIKSYFWTKLNGNIDVYLSLLRYRNAFEVDDYFTTLKYTSLHRASLITLRWIDLFPNRTEDYIIVFGILLVLKLTPFCMVVGLISYIEISKSESLYHIHLFFTRLLNLCWNVSLCKSLKASIYRAEILSITYAIYFANNGYGLIRLGPANEVVLGLGQ